MIKNAKIIVRIPIQEDSAAHNSDLRPHSIALRKSKNFGSASSFCWRGCLLARCLRSWRRAGGAALLGKRLIRADMLA